MVPLTASLSLSLHSWPPKGHSPSPQLGARVDLECTPPPSLHDSFVAQVTSQASAHSQRGCGPPPPPSTCLEGTVLLDLAATFSPTLSNLGPRGHLGQPPASSPSTGKAGSPSHIPLFSTCSADLARLLPGQALPTVGWLGRAGARRPRSW